ncbi:MAG: TolC family protein [Planctomycetota bacterium]
MICDCFEKSFASLLMWGFVGLYLLSGCDRHNYKNEADEQVYKIIDQKWQEGFGGKANYKISDTEPLPGDLQVERAVPASGVLTLPHAVAVATDHNREYRTQKEALYIVALDLRLTRHDFETQFFGGASGGYNEDWNDSAYGFEAGFGFNRLLAGGTRISSQVAAAWVDVLTGNLRSGLASILSATVTQPLLRGSGPRVVRENLTQAERNALYQVRSFNRFRKVFVVSIISQYYRVLQLSDAVRNAEENYNTINEVYERLEKLSKAGRVPQFEMDRIAQDRLRASDTLVLALRDYKQALDEFKLSLSMPADAEFELDARELEALRAAMSTKPAFSEEEVIEAALYRRLDVANSADAVIDAQRKVYVATDGLRADFNVVGVATDISSRRGDRRRLRPLREEYGLEAELGLPLDRVLEQNIYRKALIALSQRQRDYELTADTVKLEVRQAYRELTAAAERYRVQLESLHLAGKRYKNTLLLVRYGRASSRRVLRAQWDLFDTQNAATEALVDYAVAMLSFYRDAGVLQVRPDGMWEHGVHRELSNMAEPRLQG